MLDSSFTKLYQIVEVESGEPKSPTAYRIQENKNFTYEECFCEAFQKEPYWEFLDEISDSKQLLIKKAFELYDIIIREKLKEYKNAKNRIVKNLLTWEDNVHLKFNKLRQLVVNGQRHH